MFTYFLSVSLQPANPLASATQPNSLPGYTPVPTQQSQQALPVNSAWQEQLERSQRELDEAMKKQQVPTPILTTRPLWNAFLITDIIFVSHFDNKAKDSSEMQKVL